MKKTRKTALTATIFATALNFTSCTNDDDFQNVYGPPPENYSYSDTQETTEPDTEELTESSTQELTEELTEPDTEEVTEPDTQELTQPDTHEYIPKKETVAAVYGPPPD